MAVRRADQRPSREHRDDTPTVKVGVTRKMPVHPGVPGDGAVSDGDAGATVPAAPPPAPEVVVSVHERLLHAARDRFSTDGYENATTAAIARQAGTSESQLVKHFGSKEGLLEAIFDAAWTDLEAQARAAMGDQTAPVGRLLALGDAITKALERDRKLRSLLMLEGRRIRKNGRDVVISAGFRRFLAMVDDLFRAMQQQGDIGPDVDLQALRSAWMGAIEGMVRDQLLAEMMPYPANYNRKAVRKLAVLLLGAFLTPRALRQLHALAAG